MTDDNPNKPTQNIAGGNINIDNRKYKAIRDMHISEHGDINIYYGNAGTANTTKPTEDPQPRYLDTLIGHEAEKEALQTTWEQVVRKNRGFTIFLMGPYSSGRRALLEAVRPAIKAYNGFIATPDLGNENPREYIPYIRKQARKKPLMLLFNRLEREPTVWIDIIKRFTNEITQGREDLPILIVVILTTTKPLENIQDKQHTEQTRLAQELVRGKKADAYFFNPVSEADIQRYIAPADPAISQKLYELTDGTPGLIEIIWEEWVEAKKVVQKKQKLWHRQMTWQPASKDNEDMTPYGNLADAVEAELEKLLDNRENKSPYTLKEARRILNCAATEGEIFTAEAVAYVLELDKDELVDFLNNFLAPYEDDEDPANNLAGMVVKVGAVAVDEFRSVWQYRFERPYLYYVWRNFLPMPEERQKWSAQLGQALEILYYPHAQRLINKLERLFTAGNRPDLAAPYRQRRVEQFTLDSLRWQVSTLLQEVAQDPSNTFTLYRLFNVSLQLLGKLVGNATYWQEGIALTAQLLPLAEAVDDEVILGDLYYYQGWHNHNGGQYEAGLQDARQALQIAETFNLPEIDLARYNNLVGILLQAMGKLDAARPYYERALAIHEQVLGANHPDTAQSLNNLGILLYAMGELAAARPYLERALAIHEQLLGENHPDTASSLNNMGYLLQDMGELAAALTYYERALAIHEQVLGANHPATAFSLNNLGYLLQAMGELEVARPYFARALTIREQVLGANHPNTATSLNNMGALLDSMGELAAARPYYERALAIYEKVLGANHPDTARSLNNMGALLDSMGELAAARPYYERALAISEQVLGANHPHTARSLNNMGSLLRTMGEYDAARPYYERALAIREQVLGANHPDTATSLNNMGGLLQAMGELAAARPYVERALAIFKQTLGENHPDTATSLNNMAILCAYQEDFEEAARLMRQALFIREACLSANHPSTISSRQSLAVIEAKL